MRVLAIQSLPLLATLDVPTASTSIVPTTSQDTNACGCKPPFPDVGQVSRRMTHCSLSIQFQRHPKSVLRGAFGGDFEVSRSTALAKITKTASNRCLPELENEALRLPDM
ncbi:hypothetical protein SAMN06265222_108110 [Neorhodopirellula lusitana]|uniref:Secreted protein n=1 Tax=Neorhodopirellula lusitana TaxID=445327 RepID=A0ABY1QCF0_9BACT|nr:hypothetical protein SAMN06265222_108110 [Neorhodopirellula lusitana]